MSPKPLSRPGAGSTTRSKRFPSTLRHSDTGAFDVREGQVHPAVLVEVERDHAARARGAVRRERVEHRVDAFPRVEGDGHLLAGEDEIDGAVVVEIAGGDADRACDAEAALGGDVGEGAVAVVAQHYRRGRRQALGRRRAGDRPDRDRRRGRRRRSSAPAMRVPGPFFRTTGAAAASNAPPVFRYSDTPDSVAIARSGFSSLS